jgi:hypothetical protein
MLPGDAAADRVTLQNRVAPTGEIVADPARGLFTGNRGVLHDERRHLGVSRWRHKAWIICLLEYKGWKRAVMSPGRWTELFFLDEAVALAAGHRPCALCRRASYRAYLAAWAAGNDWPGRTPPRAPEIDRIAHLDRLEPRSRRQRCHAAPLDELPDGSFVRVDGLGPPGTPLLVSGRHLLPWSFERYGAPLRRPDRGTATVLTPRSTVRALVAGYHPVLHPTAVSG